MADLSTGQRIAAGYTARMILLLTIACAGGHTFTMTADLDDPTDVIATPAVRDLVVVTSVPTRLELRLDDGAKVRAAAFDVWSTSRAFPIVGLTPGRTTTVTATAITAGGDALSRSWEVTVPPPPAAFPIIEKLAFDPDRVEPGWTLLDVKVPDGDAQYLLLLDEDLEPVWWYLTPSEIGDVRLLPDGNLLFIRENGGWVADWTGRVITHYAARSSPEGDFVRIDFDGLSHELAPDGEGGFLSVQYNAGSSPAYPTSYEAPDDLAPADVADDLVVHWDSRGNTLGTLPMSAILDTSRIGFDSLDRTLNGLDWVHVNGVVPDPSDGGVLISVRHQDALVKLDADWKVQWILGNPSGWSAPWTDLLLTPVGEGFRWPYHQHAPEIAADGTIVAFDNEFHGYSPYEPEIVQPPSRAVGYRVDAAARTVEQVFSFEQTSTGVLYSDALGDADTQPTTGDVLADFGFLDGESGLDNDLLGWGRKAVRLVEWAPDGDVVLDLRLRSDLAVEPEGWKTYRVERIAAPWATAGPDAGRWVDPASTVTPDEGV